LRHEEARRVSIGPCKKLEKIEIKKQKKELRVEKEEERLKKIK
jgi:hypothetical protein